MTTGVQSDVLHSHPYYENQRGFGHQMARRQLGEWRFGVVPLFAIPIRIIVQGWNFREYTVRCMCADLFMLLPNHLVATVFN
ncbi:hypothetical protein [Nguyenibacter sp. L1]|uniref:hypothetical protein n=1 Tax=Nguyenibacter sp. L1 TaxID=3049350 RepID=UPI002B473FDA|nr:hypothetical protein [Nguyenibacter sp. L1]WRH87565.1 hypothetical protein QN315_16590 [Nguyenibacter sp. L1]